MDRDVKAPAEIAARIVALELSLLEAPTRSDRHYLEQVLDDDMIEFGKSGGIYDKRSIIQALEGERSGPAPSDQLELVDAMATLLSADTVLLTYRLRPRPPAGTEAVASLRSSVWKQTDGRWRLLFHQGTAAAD
jgi:ribonuclease HI/glyoxylase I family protein